MYKKTTYTVLATVNDGNDNNQQATASYRLVVNPQAPYSQNLIVSLARGERDNVVASTNANVTYGDKNSVSHIQEAILITEEKPKEYDLMILIDASGSMDAVADQLAVQSQGIIDHFMSQVEDEGRVRLSIGFYGNSETHFVYKSPWVETGDSDKISELKSKLTAKASQVATEIRQRNISLETLWKSLWDVTVGDNIFPFTESRDAERRIVVLCDDEVDRLENVVPVFGLGDFDRTQAEIFLKSRKIGIEIVIMGYTRSGLRDCSSIPPNETNGTSCF